jgi:hypothetical protein
LALRPEIRVLAALFAAQLVRELLAEEAVGERKGTPIEGECNDETARPEDSA